MKTPGCGKIYREIGITPHHVDPAAYRREYQAWRWANDPAHRARRLLAARLRTQSQRTRGWT